MDLGSAYGVGISVCMGDRKERNHAVADEVLFAVSVVDIV